MGTTYEFKELEEKYFEDLDDYFHRLAIEEFSKNLLDKFIEVLEEDLGTQIELKKKRMFRVFLEVNHLNFYLDMNENEIKEAGNLKKTEYLLSKGVELASSDLVINEIKDKLYNLDLFVLFTTDMIVDDYKDFCARKLPSICKDYPKYEEVYKKKVKEVCSEMVNFKIRLK